MPATAGRGLPGALAALAVAVAAGIATPGAGAEASPRVTSAIGIATIKVDSAFRREMREAGAKLTPVDPAEGTTRKLTIPVTAGETGSLATMDLGGALEFRTTGKRRARTVRVKRLSAIVSPARSQLVGRIGGTQLTVMTIRDVGDEPFDPTSGAVRFDSAEAKLTALARASVEKRLGSSRLPSAVGSIGIQAKLEPAPAEIAEPPVRPRPATAVDISSATLTWRARESWVDYLHAAGEQGGARAKDGATDGPAETIPPSSDARVYEFDYPFASGWFDDAGTTTTADDTATVQYSGAVNFFKLINPFNIDLDAGNPEIELGGSDPRAIFLLNGRRNNADQQNRRAVAVNLDQGALEPELPGGSTYTLDDIPALVPEGPTAWPIAGYYQPGDAWGKVSVSFTVADPMLP